MTYEPKTCGTCSGSKGKTTTTTTTVDGKTVTRQQWVNCGACGGRGVR